MKKQLNEIRRMQQLAGLLKEEQSDSSDPIKDYILSLTSEQAMNLFYMFPINIHSGALFSLFHPNPFTPILSFI